MDEDEINEMLETAGNLGPWLITRRASACNRVDDRFESRPKRRLKWFLFLLSQMHYINSKCMVNAF